MGHAVGLVEADHEGRVVVLGELEGHGAVAADLVVRGAEADHEDLTAVVGGVVVDGHREAAAFAELVVLLGVAVLGVAGIAVVGRVAAAVTRLGAGILLLDHAVAVLAVDVALRAGQQASEGEQEQSGTRRHGCLLLGARGNEQRWHWDVRRRRYIYSTPVKMEKIGNQVLLYTKITQSMIPSYLVYIL